MSEIGKREYEKKIERRALRLINLHPFLEGYYYYLLVNKTPATVCDYLYKVSEFLDEMEFEDPEKIQLNDYVKYLVSKKDYSSSYQITVYSALKKFSEYISINYNIPFYMEKVPRPKYKETIKTAKKREEGYLTNIECSECFENIKRDDISDALKNRNTAIIGVFLNTGIRKSALYKLDIDDFNFEKRTITVSEKGEYEREIYFSDKLEGILKDWFASREDMAEDGETAAFVSTYGTRMSATGITDVVKKYTGKTPHKLRGTYGTNLYSSTHDLYMTQQCMGHASPKTTELYIRGRKDENARRAAEIMGKLISQ